MSVGEVYSVDAEVRGPSRNQERLSSLRQVLTVLGAALSTSGAEGDLETTFERHVREMFDLRSVRLREIRTSYQARLVTPTRTADSIVLAVPTCDPRTQAVLEASYDPSRPLNDSDVEVLMAVAHLGGYVLEVARGRTLSRSRSGRTLAPLIGSTSLMQQLRERVERVALTDFTVLIEGESGTGKELVARQLHELSRRRTGPFVAVNCAAVVETLLEAELFGIEERTATGVRGRRGKFESADGGTLFLDEVSDLSLSAQAKLLRVIQDLAVERVGGHGTRRVNTRIIAATNRPLSQLTTRGLFRTDLYYRLSGVEIHVPPLRARRHDVLELARYFLERHRQTRELALSPQAEEALSLHSWPGNVRELERLMESAVALAHGERIELDDLPAAVRGEYDETFGPALAGDESFRAWGSRYARLVFERCGRNKRRACRVLDISYHTLTAYLRYADKRGPGRNRRLPGWVKSASAPPERSEA
jgi:transcriptional regulator with PAS, ATPase and Fis domain